MKDFKNKLLAGIFVYIIGVTAFYLAAKLKPEFFDIFYSNFTTEESSLPEIEEVKLYDQIEVRFVGFTKSEDADFTLAKFEVTNNTSQNVYYYGFSKDRYPFPKIKQNGEIVKNNFFRCGLGIEKQTLLPSEAVTFQVSDYEFPFEIMNNSRRQVYKPAQIGFSFQIGEEDDIDEPENGRETSFWSEEITFPNKLT